MGLCRLKTARLCSDGNVKKGACSPLTLGSQREITIKICLLTFVRVGRAVVGLQLPVIASCAAPAPRAKRNDSKNRGRGRESPVKSRSRTLMTRSGSVRAAYKITCLTL